jgi:anti-sigma regulatory factor (Ser/Thr protein kinase)
VTAGTMTRHEGFVHGVGFYEDDDEFVRMFAPFCQAGLDEGAPTVVRVEERRAGLLRDHLDNTDGVEFLAYDDQYVHAPGAMAGALDLIARHSPSGGKRLRLLGELPPLAGLARDTWIRYEATANHVLRALPVHALCPYDARGMSPAARSELLRTHHTIASPWGPEIENAAYEEPEQFIRARHDGVRDPLEADAPRLEMLDPNPSNTRHVLEAVAREMQLPPAQVDSLLLGVTEVLGNAIRHGGRPVQLRAWSRPGRVVVSVRDAGEGPTDPFVGLVPIEPGVREGGLGLWIAHQLCPEIALSVTDDGFTVRLAVGMGQASPS